MGSLQKKIDTFIDLTERGIAVTAFSVIVILVPVQVFYRYVLRGGLLWGDEIVTNLLVLVVMMGAAMATRQNCHTELKGMANKAPKPLRTLIRTCTNLATLGFILVALVCSYNYMLSAAAQKSITLKLPLWIYYLSMPLGMAFTLYEFMKLMKFRIFSEPEED